MVNVEAFSICHNVNHIQILVRTCAIVLLFYIVFRDWCFWYTLYHNIYLCYHPVVRLCQESNIMFPCCQPEKAAAQTVRVFDDVRREDNHAVSFWYLIMWRTFERYVDPFFFTLTLFIVAREYLETKLHYWDSCRQMWMANMNPYW